MQNIFIDVLPPWVETGLQPAFYDLESGTVLQQTARMYAKVRELNEAFNTFTENVTNEVNTFEDSVNATVEEYIKKFNQLHDYVHDYFDNLDVQEEINHKLDEMVEDGTLSELLSQYYVDFDENEDDNTAIDENFKSISCEYMRFRNNYIRIFHIKRFSDLAIVPTSGATATPQTGATNIHTLCTNNPNYNLYINGGAFNNDTKEPIGYCIFDGVGYTPSTVPSSWGYYCCFDVNNDLFIKKQTETPNISNLINSGAVNAFLTFQALKINGVDEASAETGVAIRQIIAQKTDGSYLVIYTDGRFYNSQGLTYEDCTDLINAIDPTIENAIALDGGGSTQTFYNGYSLIPNTNNDHFLGRVVPTAIGFKVGE